MLILRTFLTPLTAEETGLERIQCGGAWEIKRDGVGTGKKDGFSLNEGRAELLNQLDVFSFVWPSRDQLKAVGGGPALPTSFRLFSQTYILRGLIVAVPCSVPRKKGALFSN